MTQQTDLPTAPATDAPSEFDLWLAEGRRLAGIRLTLDFEIGDWLAKGRDRFFPEQIELALGEIAADAEHARALKCLEKVARAFPPSVRHKGLTFEHHAHLADLPKQEALPLLQKAGKEKMPARKVRLEAMMRKVDLGLVLPREDDPEDDAMLALCRAWNRAPKPVREDFFAMAEEAADSGFGIVEP
ncbi:MAG: hypothetical protein V2I27_09395 [Erythrobacter sp.]|jgi:hypothetical protein|nr:hypothetical protein [Erythrobacter sp.]